MPLQATQLYTLCNATPCQSLNAAKPEIVSNADIGKKSTDYEACLSLKLMPCLQEVNILQLHHVEPFSECSTSIDLARQHPDTLICQCGPEGSLLAFPLQLLPLAKPLALPSLLFIDYSPQFLRFIF